MLRQTSTLSAIKREKVVAKEKGKVQSPVSSVEKWVTSQPIALSRHAITHSRRSRERVPRKVNSVERTQGKEAQTDTARLDVTLDRATGTRLVVVGLGPIARSSMHRDAVDRSSKQEKLKMLILRR